MKAEEITIEVKANLKVDKRTAETCLKLVELYCNQTGSEVLVNRAVDGTEIFSFKYRGIAEERK